MHKPEWYFKDINLNTKETKSLKKFLNNHKDCQYRCTSIAHGNGIGTNLYILCWGCKKWEDISDVSSW